MNTTSKIIESLFSFPEKALRMLPIISEDQQQQLIQTVRGTLDWINNDSMLSGMKPAEVLCVTILGIIMIRYAWALLQFLYANASWPIIKLALFRWAA
jgi:hypothetical protein